MRRLWSASVDETVARICGQFTRFQMGYVERETAARAYIESGYTIDPTVWVTRFADNTGMDYPTAAARIIAQADAYRNALVELEAYRMDKYRITGASTPELARIEHERIISACLAIHRSLP